MNNSVEKLAKTVDEAVEEALKELNITMDEAIIEVLDEGEPGGLLGFGRRPARVRVSYELDEYERGYKSYDREEPYNDFSEEDSPQDFAPDYLEEDSDDYDAEYDGEYADEYDSEYDEEYDEEYDAEKTYQDDDYDYEEREYYDSYDEVEFADGKSSESGSASCEDYSPEEKAILEEKAVEFVAKVLQSLDIHGRISSFYTDDGSLRIDVSGEDLGNAIGRRGETLDAIQYLTTMAINRDHERYQRISLDIDHYRDRQMKQIRHKARRSAEKVLKSGRRFVMHPMSPAERRQVHLALADFQGISTYSEGREPNRSVVIAREGREKKDRRNRRGQ